MARTRSESERTLAVASLGEVADAPVVRVSLRWLGQASRETVLVRPGRHWSRTNARRASISADVVRGHGNRGRDRPARDTTEVHARGERRSDRASVRDTDSPRADNVEMPDADRDMAVSTARLPNQRSPETHRPARTAEVAGWPSA
jgi:hypothetical protein